jgi:hypothetical protein
LGLLTPFALVPRDYALKAEVFLAPRALDPLGGCLGDLNDDILALRIGTELLEVASHDLLVGPEPHKLLVCLLISKLVYETVCYILAAAGLRAFHVEAFVARACDLVGDKVSIALCAEEMSACPVAHEAFGLVGLVTDLAKDLAWLVLGI